MISTPALGRAQRNLLYGWLLFAISAAAIAGTFAFAVAMTRTPGVRLLPSARAFHVMLVAHVTFALTIWLLAFISAMWVYTGVRADLPNSRRAAWGGLALALAGTVILSVPMILFQGEAVMTDYVPLLDTPLFFVGFVVFLAGIGVTAGNYLWGVARRGPAAEPLPLIAYGMACAAIATLTAIVALGAAALRLGIGADGRAPAEYYQAMFWGMGHALQYVNVAAMVVAWYAVIGLFVGEPQVNQRLARGLFALFALLPLAAPIPYFLYDPIAVPTQKVWAIGLDTGLTVPVAFLGPLLLVGVWRARRDAAAAWLKRMPWKDPHVMAFAFSAALFVFGLLIHPAARQGTLRTPAHYHSVVVGGVTLAFMGLAYHLLTQVDHSLAWRRITQIQPYLFAGGIMLLVVGLLGAGDLGAPRKTYDAAVTGVSWLKPMLVMGGGAGIAALGGALFVGVMLRSLLRKTKSSPVTADHSVLAGVAGD